MVECNRCWFERYWLFGVKLKIFANFQKILQFRTSTSMTLPLSKSLKPLKSNGWPSFRLFETSRFWRFRTRLGRIRSFTFMIFLMRKSKTSNRFLNRFAFGFAFERIRYDSVGAIDYTRWSYWIIGVTWALKPAGNSSLVGCALRPWIFKYRTFL